MSDDDTTKPMTDAEIRKLYINSRYGRAIDGEDPLTVFIFVGLVLMLAYGLAYAISRGWHDGI